MYTNNIDHILVSKESGVLLTAVYMILVFVSKFLIHAYIGMTDLLVRLVVPPIVLQKKTLSYK